MSYNGSTCRSCIFCEVKIKKKRFDRISENKSDINLIENIAFNYLLINYFSFGHQVSPLKPLLDKINYFCD